jgi:hypothetical protein
MTGVSVIMMLLLLQRVQLRFKIELLLQKRTPVLASSLMMLLLQLLLQLQLVIHLKLRLLLVVDWVRRV